MNRTSALHRQHPQKKFPFIADAQNKNFFFSFRQQQSASSIHQRSALLCLLILIVYKLS
jgi:hypothetical protein